MGLDWMLNKVRPREGFEAEFEQLDAEFHRLPSDDPKINGLRMRLLEIGLSAIDVLECPVLGVDPAADAWFEENAYKRNQKDIAEAQAEGRHIPVEFVAFWSRPFKDVLADHRGKQVLELAVHQEGLAMCLGIAAGPLDFRGGMVAHIEALPEELRDEAFADHDADECLDYAERLHHASAELVDEQDKETVKHAVTWLEFWGAHGFGFWAWS